MIGLTFLDSQLVAGPHAEALVGVHRQQRQDVRAGL
jgi:hypothetical protein